MVPSSLRTWFVVHSIADIAFALPLFLAPHWTLTLLGWHAVDPIATRLVAAALFGIEGGPPLGWAFAAVFAAFNAVWVRYRFALALNGGAQLDPQ